MRSVGNVGRLVAVRDDPPIESGQRDIDAGRAQIGDKHMAGLGVKRKLTRRPATGRLADAALLDQAAINQLTHALGNYGARESGARHQLRART